MTKIHFASSVLRYRQEMAETVRQVIRENFIGGVKTFTSRDPLLSGPEFLPPPRIEAIELSFYQGQVDDQVMLWISSDLGLADVGVVILDHEGNVIERGEADPFPESDECWSYVCRVPVPAGTSVTVHAAAIDCLGGVGSLWAQATI